MQISVINNFDQLDEIKSHWDAVYTADTNCQVFSSWTWMRGWLELQSNSWIVLAVQSNDEKTYVAFLPLVTKIINTFNINLYYKLCMGGHGDADHTGFICLPQYEEQAIEAFAIYIQQHLQWDEFYMNDVLDKRLDLFLKYFDLQKLSVQKSTGVGCPYIPLPDNWETYLQDYAGKWLRRDLRRALRKLESNENLQIRYLNADNLDEQIETLLFLNQSRWGVMPEKNKSFFSSLFQHCYRSNILWSCVLLHENVPIAALIGFVEYSKKNFMAYMIGHDDKYEKLKPGKILYGYSIKYAIENGFNVYDLGRGNYDYKYEFGAKECFNTNVWIRQRNIKTDVTNIGIGMKIIYQRLKKNKILKEIKRRLSN
jgi:CelD/BcsL family acetyltransferase involved in cellulose biosynthesis